MISSGEKLWHYLAVKKTIKTNEDAKILEFNQYQKSGKAPFIICADLECLIEKIDESENDHLQQK